MMMMQYRNGTNCREHCAKHIASLVQSSTIVTVVDDVRGGDVKSCHGKAYLLDSPSHLRMLVKTQVVAGMFSPIANVSVAKRHCTKTHRICDCQLKDRLDGTGLWSQV